jgi:hypothetical protein
MKNKIIILCFFIITKKFSQAGNFYESYEKTTKNLEIASREDTSNIPLKPYFITFCFPNDGKYEIKFKFSQKSLSNNLENKNKDKWLQIFLFLENDKYNDLLRIPSKKIMIDNPEWRFSKIEVKRNNCFYFLVNDDNFNNQCGYSYTLSCLDKEENDTSFRIINFTLDEFKEYNLIEWTTINQNKDDYFTVEKSKNGKDFYRISNLKQNKNNKHKNKYSLFDYDSFNGTLYYKIILKSKNNEIKNNLIIKMRRN